MKNEFKREKDKGILANLMLIIEVPLNFLRDYSTPMGEEDAWDRTRAAILPVTMMISFFYLNGDLQNIGTVDETMDQDSID